MKKYLLLCLTSLLLCGCVNTAELKHIQLVDDKVKEYIDGIKPISEFENSKLDKQKEYTIPLSNDETKYDFTISLSKDYSDPITYENVIKDITLTNLLVDTTYYYKAVNKETNEVISDSFITQSYAPRFMNVDGINNVRDMGGWDIGDNKKIKQGLIFRGSEMNNHYNITEEGKEVMRNSMKIKTDLDLRSNREANNITESPLGSDIDFIHLPNFSGYIAVTTKKDQIPYYQTIFKLLANPESYPIYIHCYQGADRTGTICSMIEGLLGVSDEDRLKDYNLTTFSSGDDAFRDGESSNFNYSFIQSNIQATYPSSSFKESMERYVKERLGLTDEEVASIRNILSGEISVNTADIALKV